MDEGRLFVKLESIETKIDSVDNNTDELLQWKAAMDERCSAHRQQTKELRTDIYEGNPAGLGIKDKVQSLWETKNKGMNWKDFWMRVLQSVVAAVIVVILAWLLFIYKKN